MQCLHSPWGHEDLIDMTQTSLCNMAGPTELPTTVHQLTLFSKSFRTPDSLSHSFLRGTTNTFVFCLSDSSAVWVTALLLSSLDVPCAQLGSPTVTQSLPWLCSSGPLGWAAIRNLGMLCRRRLLSFDPRSAPMSQFVRRG